MNKYYKFIYGYTKFYIIFHNIKRLPYNQNLVPGTILKIESVSDKSFYKIGLFQYWNPNFLSIVKDEKLIKELDKLSVFL